jgi:7-cyano-7-deazaguanine synthase
MTERRKAVVLLSGGLDSATCLAIARQKDFDCYCISFYYGQKSHSEVNAARKVAKALGALQHKVIRLDLGSIGGSALTDSDILVPHEPTTGIPVTYVPARNTVFLSIALGWAEVLEARHIFVGVNAVDYSGYPDCRPEFVSAFEQLANVATKAGVEGQKTTILAPLIDLTKAQIIQKGTELSLDYGLTISCYDTNESGEACGECDSCRLRIQGFEEAGVKDPTKYQS